MPVFVRLEGVTQCCMLPAKDARPYQAGLYLECSGRDVTGEQGVCGTEVPQWGPGAEPRWGSAIGTM